MDQSGTYETAVDETFRVLADERRRWILAYLTDCPDRGASLSSVAAGIANHGLADGPADPAAIEADLHHTHLPAMADAGLVDYDPDAKTVEYVAPDSVSQLLSIVTQDVE